MKKTLAMYPWPMHSSVANAISDNVIPLEALPGTPGPVLAVRHAPPWACDAVVVTHPSKLQAAVEICTEDGIQLVTVRDFLSEILSPGSLLAEFRDAHDPAKVSFQ